MQCRVLENGANGPKSFEIRIKCPTAQQSAVLAGLQRFGRICVTDGILLTAATVTGFGDSMYFVVTDTRGQRDDNAFRTWKNDLKKVVCSDLRNFSEIAEVEFVRPFTRLSQRRFGWGDAQATKEDVVKAVREGNDAELLAIMPEARSLILRSDLEQLPAVFDATRCGLPPAIADCTHEFFTERMQTANVLGPCGACGQAESDTYTMGFTQCSKCGNVRCKPCAVDMATAQNERRSFLRSYHEVTQSHTWEASQEECDACDKDVQTQQCACGIVRCSTCLHVHKWCDPVVPAEGSCDAPARGAAGTSSPPFVSCTLCGEPDRVPRKVCSCGETRCESCFLFIGGSLVETWFYAHPRHQPGICYITDQQRASTAHKLEWISYELGRNADLISFARKFRELFGEHVQKAVCLKLYREYANVAKGFDSGPYPTVAESQRKAYTMECQVPPGELEKFQKLWDDGAPRRCYETNSELPADTPLGQHFCSPEHADASRIVACARVIERRVDEDGDETVIRCGGRVVYRGDVRVCSVCDKGADTAALVEAMAKHQGDTSLCKSIKRGAENLRLANNAWGFSSQNDPDHVPAWTKRRRL